MDNKRILKFIDGFEKQLNDSGIPDIQIVDNPSVGDGFKELGFMMDCGHSFEDRYGDAFRDPDSLEKIIDDIDDLQVLGSAIFSKWRYYNHWAMEESIRDEESMRWFNMIIKRMMELV